MVSRCPCPPFPSSQLSPHSRLNPQGEHKAESCTVTGLPKWPSQRVPASEGRQMNVASCCFMPTWSSLSGCTCPPPQLLCFSLVWKLGFCLQHYSNFSLVSLLDSRSSCTLPALQHPYCWGSRASQVVAVVCGLGHIGFSQWARSPWGSVQPWQTRSFCLAFPAEQAS